MTELLIATKKGLFALEGEPGAEFSAPARAFGGDPVDYAMRDPRSGRLLASVTSPFYGPKIFFADEPGGEWTQAEGVALPPGGGAALARVWTIVAGEEDGLLYAGGDPGVPSRAATAGSPGRSTRRCGTSPAGPTGSPAAAGCASTRSSRGRVSPIASRWASRPPASG